MTIKKTIYVNSSGVLTLSATDNNGFQLGGTPLIFKRGDTVTLNVVFLDESRAPITLANGTELIMAVKPLNEYDSQVLYAYNTLTVNGQAATGYDFTFDLNSTSLGEALRLNEPFEADVASITGMLELTWTSDGGATYHSTQNVAPFTVNNDVIRGTESTPLSLPSPETWLNQRAIRFDSTQSLTALQKSRVQANIGLPKTNWSATAAPTVDADETQGYSIGSLWIDASNKEAYRCVSAIEGEAEWIETTLEAGEVVQSVSKTSLGLGNVDDTSDADKPISTAQQTALDLKAPLASPAFTGTPTAPTPQSTANDAQLATTEFVQGLISASKASLNYTGAYDIGASYEVGDLAVYQGQLFYRKDANGGNTGDTPFDGSAFWDLIAAKGEQGISGEKGEKGDQGDQGEVGASGPANSLSIGTVASGATASATITGTAPSQVLNLVLEKGETGDAGPAGPAGPQGIQGIQGVQGAVGATGPAGPEPSLNVLDNASTAITLAGTDNNKIVRCTASSAVTVTVPSTLASGFSCMVIQAGAGQVTFVEGSGATLNSFGNLFKTAGQHAPASLIRIGAGVYNLSGNLV